MREGSKGSQAAPRLISDSEFADYFYTLWEKCYTTPLIWRVGITTADIFTVIKSWQLSFRNLLGDFAMYGPGKSVRRLARLMLLTLDS